MPPLLEISSAGLYCRPGDFWIDPWRPVTRAVVTHAHSDHARPGSRHYLAAADNRALLPMRLGSEAELELVPYGEPVTHGGCTITLHPAGHMLGAAQVRVEHRGRVAVVTGDYKLGPDPTCLCWEPVPCDLLVTETTFGLPIYRWPDPATVAADLNRWWRSNAEQGRTSVLYGYAIGKSQRLLAMLDAEIGPIYTHGAVERGVRAYRDSGVALPETIPVSSTARGHDFAGAMILAVPSAHGTPWLRRFGDAATAMASGWMMVRGQRRRRSMDRGFVLSDHVDWPSLLEAVEACGCQQVWATHGSTRPVVRYLRERGLEARALETRFGDEEESEVEDDEATTPAPKAERPDR